MRRILAALAVVMVMAGNAWGQSAPSYKEGPNPKAFVKVGIAYVSADVPRNRGGQNLGNNQWNLDVGFSIGTDAVLFSASMLPDGNHGYDGGMPVFNLDLTGFNTKNLRSGLGISIAQIYADIDDESRIKRDRVLNPYMALNYVFLRNFYLDAKVGIGNRSIYSGFGVCVFGKCGQ